MPLMREQKSEVREPFGIHKIAMCAFHRLNDVLSLSFKYSGSEYPKLRTSRMVRRRLLATTRARSTTIPSLHLHTTARISEIQHAGQLTPRVRPPECESRSRDCVGAPE